MFLALNGYSVKVKYACSEIALFSGLLSSERGRGDIIIFPRSDFFFFKYVSSYFEGEESLRATQNLNFMFYPHLEKMRKKPSTGMGTDVPVPM